MIEELERKAQQKSQAKNKYKIRRNSYQQKAQKKDDWQAKAFRMISKIEPQKRKGRYNIYINEEFAFGVDEEVLLKFHLNKGMHITPDLEKEIEAEESY